MRSYRFVIEHIPPRLAALRRAISDADFEAIETIAHRLKGKIGYLGIYDLLHKARELERMGKEHQLQHAAKLVAAFEAEMSLLDVMHKMNDAKAEAQSILEPSPSLK